MPSFVQRVDQSSEMARASHARASEAHLSKVSTARLLAQTYDAIDASQALIRRSDQLISSWTTLRSSFIGHQS
jgi:hypothetical protein